MEVGEEIPLVGKELYCKEDETGTCGENELGSAL